MSSLTKNNSEHTRLEMAMIHYTVTIIGNAADAKQLFGIFLYIFRRLVILSISSSSLKYDGFMSIM